jgi:hypothetical protein
MKEVANNYHPITFVPALSKILEKVIANQLVSIFEKHSILNKSQFGLKKNKSTKHAVGTVIDNKKMQLCTIRPFKSI